MKLSPDEIKNPRLGNSGRVLGIQVKSRILWKYEIGDID